MWGCACEAPCHVRDACTLVRRRPRRRRRSAERVRFGRAVHLEDGVGDDIVVLGGPPRLHGAVAAAAADGDAAGAGEEGGGVGGGEGGGGGVEGGRVLLRDHPALDRGDGELRRIVLDGAPTGPMEGGCGGRPCCWPCACPEPEPAAAAAAAAVVVVVVAAAERLAGRGPSSCSRSRVAAAAAACCAAPFGGSGHDGEVASTGEVAPPACGIPIRPFQSRPPPPPSPLACNRFIMPSGAFAIPGAFGHLRAVGGG